MSTMTRRALAASACTLAVATGATTTAPAGAATTPHCTSGDLRVSLVDLDGAAGSTVGDLRLTNRTAGWCWTRGWPGVSWVGYGNGTQVGRAATWDAGTVTTVLLAPGRSAYAPVRMVRTWDYPTATCLPTPVDGLRVYVPDATLAKFVPAAGTACRSLAVRTLFVKPVRATP